MVSAKDFEVGELVRFKEEKDQLKSGPYKSFYGHICVVLDWSDLEPPNLGHEYDCIRVRSIGTGEVTECYVHRLEKYNEDR